MGVCARFWNVNSLGLNHDLESDLDKTCIFGLIFKWVVGICEFCRVLKSESMLTFWLTLYAYGILSPHCPSYLHDKHLMPQHIPYPAGKTLCHNIYHTCMIRTCATTYFIPVSVTYNIFKRNLSKIK